MIFTEEQFTAIYNDHVHRIYRFCYLKVSSREDAQDITSDVFLKFIHYVQKREREIENTRAFLYQTARNLVIDYYRAREKKPLPLDEDLLEKEEVPQLESPEKAAILFSDINEVSNALKNIHTDYADLIIWRYLDELEIPEISEINGKSEGANRVALSRALKALRGELEVPRKV